MLYGVLLLAIVASLKGPQLLDLSVGRVQEMIVLILFPFFHRVDEIGEAPSQVERFFCYFSGLKGRACLRHKEKLLPIESTEKSSSMDARSHLPAPQSSLPARNQIIEESYT